VLANFTSLNSRIAMQVARKIASCNSAFNLLAFAMNILENMRQQIYIAKIAGLPLRP
jgi:hypothetical protein